MEDARRPALLDALPGPWVCEPSGLPAGGPRSWWRGPSGLALAGPPARVAAELAGWERLGAHPARPEILVLSEDCVVLEPVGEPVGDGGAALLPWPGGDPWTGRGRVGALLDAVPGRVDPGRALATLGMKRGRIDRLLGQERSVATRLGPSFGGIGLGWLYEAGDRVVALRWGQASARGWSAWDLAGVALGLEAPEAELLRARHQAGLDSNAANNAWSLSLLRRALDEAVLGRDEDAGALALEIASGLLPGAPPDRVRVSLEGAPDWLDPAVWLPADGQVPAARARWLLQELDGLSVGGSTLRVTVDPPLRAGRRPPPRSAQRERRKALFSRWEQGIRADEEGLWSATPEALADQLVAGLRGHVVDGTCGIGSLALALARRREVTRITAIDLDEDRLQLARHNAGVYGVRDRIRFVHGDAAEVLKATPCDALVLDPPWGGRSYDRESVGLSDLGMDLQAALAVAPPVVRLKLPRSFDASALAALPGTWKVQALVDGRGVVKMLVAGRG